MDTIDSWAQACDYLARKGRLDRVDDHHARLTVTHGEIEVVLELAASEVAGAPCLEVRARVGEARVVSPVVMLHANSELAVGTLALARDGAMVLRHVLALTGARPADVDVVVGDVAAGTLRARAGLERARPTP